MTMSQDEILTTGATGLAQAIREGRISSREALDFHLDRVERLNPKINAVIAIDADAARKRAQEADAARAGGESWGPLHGLPMTVKDAYEVTGMATVCGAPALENHRPKTNALAVQRLMEAGAIVFGKTNTPLFAGDIQTYNAVFGTTHNPWNLERTCGGSSGGSAAALAAGLTPLELGSDLAGSIRTPAHWCGVFGHKPSHGLIPLRGHIPGPPGTLSEPDLAVGGPLARSAEDLQLALDILAGPDPRSAKAWSLELPPPRSSRLSDLRVACHFDDPFCPVDGATRSVLDQTAKAWRQAGAMLSDTPPPVPLPEAFESYERLLDAVIGAGLPPKVYARLTRGAPFMRWLGRDECGRLGRFMNASTQRFRDWARFDEARQHQRARWDEYFTHFDVLLMPVTPTAAIRHDPSRNLFSRRIDVDGLARPYTDQFVWIGPASSALLPVTVMPAGQSPDGLPIGVQIVGPYLEDRTTIEVARLLSRASGGFTPPPGFD